MAFINDYVTASFVSLYLFCMAMTALTGGIRLFRENTHSAGNRKMFFVFICVFLWDFGYAWMGLCYDSGFAYAARAIALAGVFLYIAAIVEYTGYIAGHPIRYRYPFYILYGIASLVCWVNIIDSRTVSFQMTPWGYWYKTQMTWARYLQFICLISAISYYYVILRYWWKRVELKREHNIIRGFMWFAPVVFAGYLFDTLIPGLLDVPAIPGSAVSAFASSLMLFTISKKNMAFDVNEHIVSEYVFRDVNSPVLVMDWRGYIVMWNQTASKYFNRPGNELKGLKKTDLVSLPHEDYILKDISGEEIYITNDRRLYCEFSTTEIFDEYHEPLYTLCFVRDITETQNAMRMMDESRRIAENANQSKNAFLANMSHEIRTPMNAIIGMSDILIRDSKLDGEEKQQLLNIREAGESLLGIINDVLDISKIEAGRYELVENPYECADMIHAVSSILRMRLAETSVECIVDVDPEMAKTLIGDELRIRQIFINILGNAAKYTDAGYIKLSVKGVMESEGYRVFADVEDTGSGIREADLARIFEAFNQVDTHRNRNKQGTGLGLSIALKLAQSMGGNITVDSTYGRGTTFHINILQQVTDYEPIGEEVCNRLRKDEYEYSTEKNELNYTEPPDKKILVVDDSKVNLMVAKGLLAPYMMEMDFATSGKEAVAMASKKDYDLIFMDHMMPGMDGVETSHALRSLGGHNAEVAIIALTANAIEGTKEKLMAEGMQDFIAKPIDKFMLNDVLEKYLGN